MNCPKCRSAKAVKNGIMKQKQRYKCKKCGCNFTQSTMARIPLETRIEAIKLYLEGVGFRRIERLTSVHHTTVMKWVKNLASEIERLRPEMKAQITTIEIDEMWHFIQKNTKMLGLDCLG